MFFDLDFSLSASTFHGASKSNIQISPSDPFAKVPFFIFFVIIIYTHRENIVRLKNSEESKIKL